MIVYGHQESLNRTWKTLLALKIVVEMGVDDFLTVIFNF